MPRAILVLVLSSFCLSACLSAAAQMTYYVGALGGISTLSGDAGSHLSQQAADSSSYKPDNGAALNVFAGMHLHNWFSLQGNYIRSQNDLLLTSVSSGSNTFYAQTRTSSTQAAVLDFLLYFRSRRSRIRPYLGTGGGVLWLRSRANRLVASGGVPDLPPYTFTSNRPVFRSHVGIDLRLTRKLDFRYSFSEMLATNTISRELSPPGPSRLKVFQNLFGLVLRF